MCIPIHLLEAQDNSIKVAIYSYSILVDFRSTSIDSH
jgi:hypothetical protein